MRSTTGLWEIILLRLLKGEFNHENKQKFLTILTLCIALLLTACGTTDAAGTDKTNESLTETGTVSTDSSNTALNDLYQQENQILQIMRLYGTRYSA